MIFKKIFGEHPKILKSFLNAMLPLPAGHEIVELEYLSPDMIPPTFLEKFSCVDVRCKDNKGRQFLVEMQMNWTTAFKHRVLFNASKAYVTQTSPVTPFSKLKPVYALNLINENYLPDSPEYYHHYAIVSYKDTNECLEGLEFVFVELQKFKARNITEKKLQVLWLRFLTEINETTSVIDKSLYEHQEIIDAIACLKATSITDEERFFYEKTWDRISSELTMLSSAEEKGKAEGIEIGLGKGLLVSALRLLTAGVKPDSILDMLHISTERMGKIVELHAQYGDDAEEHTDEIN